jgi:hypothetical protein
MTCRLNAKNGLLLLTLFLAGCAAQGSGIPLPLRESEIIISPSALALGDPVNEDEYKTGFIDGWYATSWAFADDIKHRHDFQEDIGGADSSYWGGWRAARNEVEVLVRHLAGKIGERNAQEKLRAAIQTSNRPARPPDPSLKHRHDSQS